MAIHTKILKPADLIQREAELWNNRHTTLIHFIIWNYNNNIENFVIVYLVKLCRVKQNIQMKHRMHIFQKVIIH